MTNPKLPRVWIRSYQAEGARRGQLAEAYFAPEFAPSPVIEYAPVSELEELKEVLKLAKVKLKLYRENHSGEYLGGMEYTQLMHTINDALGVNGER